MTTLHLERLDGAMRARPDEGQWAGLLAAQGVDPSSLPGALAPVEWDPVPVAASPEVGHAAAFLAGAAPVRVEVRTRSEGLGVVALLVSDGSVCASVVRRVVASDGRPSAVPGVELSAFGARSLVEEVLRLLPRRPDRLDPAVTGPVELELPVEAAVMLSRALVREDVVLAQRVAELAGLDEVPALVESLADRLPGEAAVGVTVPSSGFGALRSWLLCSLGWVALELRGDRVLHRLVTADHVRDDLVFDVTGGLTALATGSGSGRG